MVIKVIAGRILTDDQLTNSVIDFKHLWDFSWLTVTSGIEGNHSEPVLTTGLQTGDHKPGATDFSVLGLKNTNMEWINGKINLKLVDLNRLRLLIAKKVQFIEVRLGYNLMSVFGFCWPQT